MTLKIREQLYKQKLDKLKGIKINEGVKIIYKKEYYDAKTESMKIQHITHIFPYKYVFTNSSQINNTLSESIDNYIEDIDNFQHEGSGWKIEQFKGIYI